ADAGRRRADHGDVHADGDDRRARRRRGPARLRRGQRRPRRRDDEGLHPTPLSIRGERRPRMAAGRRAHHAARPDPLVARRSVRGAGLRRASCRARARRARAARGLRALVAARAPRGSRGGARALLGAPLNLQGARCAWYWTTCWNVGRLTHGIDGTVPTPIALYWMSSSSGLHRPESLWPDPAATPPVSFAREQVQLVGSLLP